MSHDNGFRNPAWRGGDIGSQDARRHQGDARHHFNARAHGQPPAEALHDPDYQQWRRAQLEQLDADYEAYRREHSARFAADFEQWRTERAARAGSPQQQGGDTADASRN